MGISLGGISIIKSSISLSQDPEQVPQPDEPDETIWIIIGTLSGVIVLIIIIVIIACCFRKH